MIAVLAVETGIPPAALWAADPADLATMVDVMTQAGKRAKRRR